MTTECGSNSVLPMPFSGNHTHPLASTSGAGVMELATDAEVVANPDTLEALAVTPYTLGHYTGLVAQVASVETSDLLLVRDVSANKDVSYTFGALKDAVTPPQATTEVLGIIELATDAEVLAGIDAERAVTPAGLEAWSDANQATETERGLIELATDAEVITGTDAERAVTPAGLEAWSVANPATETDRGLIELATDAEVITGTDTDRAVTPAGVEAWAVANPATEADRGLIELAANAEVIAGTDAERAVTPAGLEAWSDANPATETERGLIELATDAEVITGTDTDRAVTPAGVEAWSDANPATETERGLIELATEAEVLAGTDAERAVTPAGLEAWSVSSPALAMARTHTDATWFHMKGESSMGGGNVYLKATGLVCDNPYVVNGEFIVPEGGAGLWVFSGYIHFPHNKAISNAYAALMVDGNANMYGSRSATNYGTYQAMSALSAIWPLDEGTRVAIGFWSEAGSEGQSLPFINFRGARIAL